MTTTTDQSVVPVPEPDLTPDQIIERARALRNQLIEEQEEADQRGCYSADIHKKLQDAGIYRILQPRMFGGYEFDVPTLFRVMVEISRGGPGSGWCASLATGHALVIAAHFSEESQRIIFGPDGDFRAPHRAAPGGTARPVDGGYVVDGKWRFSSGIPYSTHFMGTTLAFDREGPPRPIVVVVPKGEYTMLDDWGGSETLGLRASGSNTVVLNDCFVPQTMVCDDINWFNFDVSRGTSGTRLHGNPMYLGRTAGFYHGELISAQVGAAFAALDEYERLMRTTKTRMPPQVLRVENSDDLRILGLALEMADAAQAILIGAGEQYMEYCRLWDKQGRPFTVADDLRLWGQLQQAGKLCWEAVELLFRSADSSVVGRGDSRLQRYYRDLSMYRGHFAAQYDQLTPMFARAYLGLPAQLAG